MVLDNKATGFVFIIESPSEDDLLDGRTEGRSLVEALKLSGIDGWYSLISSKSTFYKAIGDRLTAAIQAFPNKSPVFHFSMHGNINGLALLNGEFITWEELRVALAPLHNAMNGKSLVCMSSCEGASAIRMAMIEDAALPFGILVGNIQNAKWDDAAVAYVTFYHHFFKNTPVPQAVEAMRIASDDESFMFWEGKKVKSDWEEHVRRQTLLGVLEK